jgi:hydroxymethylpyrimidine/phosphomethylpyrimidine kinase
MHRLFSPPIALTIAGSDPSGGAGLQADLKTFHQHGVYGTSVVTLLTVQSTQAVPRVEVMPADLVGQQLDFLLDDVTPHAAKTGALGSAAVVEAVAHRAARFKFPLVVDPVMVSKHGHPLLDAAAAAAVKVSLLPHALLVTPNTQEAGLLSGRRVESLEEARDAAKAIAQMGPRAVLVKGGHLEGPAVDILYFEGTLTEFRAERIASPHTHGTGCTLSAAVVSALALGRSLPEAVAFAKRWLTEAIRTAPRFGLGVGPVNHFARVP